VAEGDLLVFSKAPRPGLVKTRLVPPLSPEGAAAVHEACLRDVVQGARRIEARLRIVYDDTPGAAKWFARAFPDLEVRPQSAGDLGTRLKSGFAERFHGGAGWVIAIGADSPTLPLAYVTEAIETVRGATAAIGPTDDGGYYLIGLHRTAWPAAAALFDGVPWSTEQVFQTTRERADEIGLGLRVLPSWYDIDTGDDLRLGLSHAGETTHLARLCTGGGVTLPETRGV
jgi:uncharacterized protein